MRLAALAFLCLVACGGQFHAAALSDNTTKVERNIRHQNYLGRDSNVERHRLLKSVDPLVVERFKKVKPGQRKHPSYYSERYLSRARPYTTEQWDQLANEWGSWKLQPSAKHPSASDEFYKQFPNRDVPYDKLPDDAWQKDKAYVESFLNEAIALAERGLEAILSEYGLGKKDLPDKDFEARSVKFRPALGDKNLDSGGWMPAETFENLKRRILHSILSEDSFNIAMGGHSGAAGHGNNFPQVYTSAMQRIMEPVFARLGVKMSCRNFGQGGLGTLHNGVAAGAIYGRDVDVLLWDSGMTEKEQSARGILAIQGLLGMDKAPILWFQRDDKVLANIRYHTGADIAIYGSTEAGGWPAVSTAEELGKLPWAIQYKCCPQKELADYCKSQRWMGTCWEDRSNFEWEGIDLSYKPKGRIQDAPGGRAGWHPGNREHQLQARSFTFVIFLALRDALKAWKEKPDFVMPDADWHMTDLVEGIKSKVVEHKDEWTPWCKEKGISEKYCIYRAEGRTENTPRNRPWATSLRSIMSGSEHPNMNLGDNLYDPPDVYNPFLHPPEGQIDVLAILENGADFSKNLARIRDSAENMEGIFFTDEGTGSKHNKLEIKGGKGWQFENQETNAASDNCDGQHDSFCKRRGECLMYGHNDARTGIFFDGFSGWLIFNVPKVEKGNIMIKMHTWAFFPPKITEGWCSENNEKPCTNRALSSGSNSSSVHRMLKPPVPKYCDNFKMEFAIDGKITSWTEKEILEHQKYAQRVVEFWTLLDEDDWDGPKDVEVALRVTGCGRQKPYDLTHIYWI